MEMAGLLRELLILYLSLLVYLIRYKKKNSLYKSLAFYMKIVYYYREIFLFIAFKAILKGLYYTNMLKTNKTLNL